MFGTGGGAAGGGGMGQLMGEHNVLDQCELTLAFTDHHPETAGMASKFM